MEEAAIAPFNASILSELKTYEDYLSFYIQLDQTSSTVAWIKADLLYQMHEKLGEASLEQLSRDLKQKPSTVSNYVRTARAFPQEKRDPKASFSIHFKASYADSYDDKTHEFDGEERFKWLEKAVDEDLSTRDLSDAIYLDKQKKLLGEGVACIICNQTTGEVKMYNFLLHAVNGGSMRDRLMLHDMCYNKIIDFIYAQKG